MTAPKTDGQNAAPPPAPIALEQAQRLLLQGLQPLDELLLPVADAAGHYLSGPLLARRNQPAADLSAMDGYAMPADDLAGPWRLVGESAAGHPFTGTLQPGDAVRISTGALMPAGSGTVLLQENARRDGTALYLADGEPDPRHIRRAGFDFTKGSSLLEAGTLIGPAQAALALMGGHGQLPVRRLPRLAVLDSGDELATNPQTTAAHQIPASNGAMLAAMARPLAADVARLGPIADSLPALVRALDLAENADVILTTGGASVGDHDLVRPAVQQWGAEISFWRVALKPGKPLMVARRGRQIILGLPGNPVSAYVTAFLFLLPLLRALAGCTAPLPVPRPARLTAPMPATEGRMEFVRGFATGGQVTPSVQQDSSGLMALAHSNALIQRAAHAPPASIGDAVLTYNLANGGNA